MASKLDGVWLEPAPKGAYHKSTVRVDFNRNRPGSRGYGVQVLGDGPIDLAHALGKLAEMLRDDYKVGLLD